MPIRFKTVEYCWWEPKSGNDPSPTQICVDQTVPIRDWNIIPAQIDKQWTQGSEATSLFQDVQFPELEALYSGKIKYKIKKNFTSVDWVKIRSAQFGNSQEFEITSETVIRFFIDFVNLDNLPVGLNTIDIIFEAYQIDQFNNENYLERFNSTITINVKAGAGISTDKNTYSLTFNKANNTLSGDEKIIVYSAENVDFSVDQAFIQLVQSVKPDQRWLTFSNNSEFQNKNVGNHTGKVTITQNGFAKNINVSLDVINDATEFDVNPKQINLSAQRSPGEIKTINASLSNPNNLNIIVDLKPTWISSVNISNNIITIKTENSNNLAIGNYSGKVVLKAGTKIKEISVSLSVFSTLEHDFKNSAYFFALDKNKVTLFKSDPAAIYAKMKLEMYFKGYGHESTVIQEYSIPYFKGKADFLPGREVNDFFYKCDDLDLKDVTYLLNLAQVKMTFNEMSDKDSILSTITIDNVLFAPGRKPACFPVFTDYKIRRTFPLSNMILAVDRLSQKDPIKKLKDIYLEKFSDQPPTSCIDAYRFKREQFYSSYNKKIISAGELMFIPLPEKRKVIHIYWENQNRVFEWFSAPLKYQQNDEIENIFSETSIYKEEKTSSTESSLVIINSGWILEEEIPMITDLLKSRICFIELNGKKIKAIPVGKNNELLRSDENTYQMDLEFKIMKKRQ